MGKSDKQTDEYESFLSDDCLKDFLRIIKRNKPATKEDNFEMFLEYQKGNLAMRDLIAKRNLLLVVSLASSSGRNLSSEEKLDYIQSGVIGLMEAIDSYDLSRGTTFSTHAEYWIQMRINRCRYNYKRVIRRPEYIVIALNRYRKLVNQCEKENKPLPPRDEICQIIDATEETLQRIEEDYKQDTASLDAPISTGDSDDGSYEDILGEESKGFNDVLDKIVVEEILKTLKMTLSAYEYYIYYYHVLNKQKVLEELGEYFGVTRERIRQVEEKITSNVRKMFDNDHALKRKYVEEVKKQYPFESINTSPCPLENYTLFFFLRDNFNEKDQIILKEKLIGNLFFDIERVAKEINENSAYVKNISKKIDKLIQKNTNDIRYHLFHEKLKRDYRGSIYLLDLDSDLSDYFEIKKDICAYWQDKSVDDILNLATSNNIPCDITLIEKIKRFCGSAPKKDVTFNKDHLERDVNYSLFGFANHEIPLSKLYPIFLENQNKFTTKQIDYLNMYVFKKEKPTQNDESVTKYYGDSIINKLLLIYYNIEDYKKDNFSYEKYMSVRSKCQKDMEPEDIKLLDLYYGVKGNPMNTREMAEFLHEEELSTENNFRRAKNNAISIYLGTVQYSYESDRELYASILEDEEFTLVNPHFDVSKMFFLEGKSYEEIAEEYEIVPKFTSRKVAELVKYACNAMDFYRFGITSTKKTYSKEFLLSVLEGSNYDEETKDVMRTYIDTKSTSITANIHHKDINEINNTARKLNNLANKVAVDKVDITKKDVEASVMEHESTNVLNERERIMLSMVYGLENKYNPSGKKRHPVDIAAMLGIDRNITSLIKKAKEHVAAHKIGLLKTARDFIDRKELESALRDPRLPLSKEDRNIIINAYGLYDTEYLTTQEIAKNMGIKEPIVRSRLYKGIVTIKRYLNKEIDGEVLFKIDVKPYLKYFILEDREILTHLYRDKWKYSKIEKKYGLTHHQFTLLLQKLRMHLSDLRSNTACGIDFDYFWSNALESDIPYYGNKELAVELCFLYYEKRITQSDIVKYHHPELGDTTVNEMIKAFTIAVIKHQNGIRKINDFSCEEIADYYEAHKDGMGVVSTKIYRNYFAKVKKNGPASKLRPNKDITYDLIREKYQNYFQLKNATPEEVKEILGKFGHTMPKETIEKLESLFGVTHANLLNDEDWEEIINFLGPLQLIIEKNKKEEENNKEDEKKSIFC